MSLKDALDRLRRQRTEADIKATEEAARLAAQSQSAQEAQDAQALAHQLRLQALETPYRDILLEHFERLKPVTLLEEVKELWGNKAVIDPEPQVAIQLPSDYWYKDELYLAPPPPPEKPPHVSKPVTGSISLGVNYPFKYRAQEFKEYTRRGGYDQGGDETFTAPSGNWINAAGQLRVELGLELSKKPYTDYELRAYVRPSLPGWPRSLYSPRRDIAFDAADIESTRRSFTELLAERVDAAPYPHQIPSGQRLYDKGLLRLNPR